MRLWRYSGVRGLPSRGRAIAFGALAIVAVLHGTGHMPYAPAISAALFDGYQRVLPRERVSGPVVIVDIDEPSLSRYGQWPWPRSLLARLITRVQDMAPAAIGIDILMPEPDRTSPCSALEYIQAADALLRSRVCALPGNDELLADALRQGQTVLGTAGIDGPGTGRPTAAPMRSTGGGDPLRSLRKYESGLTSLAQLNEAAAGHAVLSVDVEDGIVRHVPLAAVIAGVAMPSLPIEMLRLAGGSSTFEVTATKDGVVNVGAAGVSVPTQSDGTLWVRFGPHDAARFVSAVDILDNKVDPERVRQRLVLIGLSGVGLTDFPTTPLRERMPGVEVHAQVLETIFDGTTLLHPRWALWVEAAGVAVAGVMVILALTHVNAMLAMALLTLMTASGVAAAVVLYAREGLLVDPASPALLLWVLFGGFLMVSEMREQKRRKLLEIAMQRQREERAKLAGEMAAATRIQMGIVPDVAKTFASEPRIDIAARMIPAREVGGDLYDCFKLDEDRVFFIVGDVCGKGVPASLFMAISKTLCKSLALRDSGRLDELMRQANVELSRENPEQLFVTAFCGVVDLRTGELWYCNAGHERPFISVAGAAPRELSGRGGPPLCVRENHAYKVERYDLLADEFVCIFSDGVTEACDKANTMFGRDRLKAVLAETPPSASAEVVLDSICRRVQTFVAGAEPSDDLTVLVFRRPAA